MFLQKGEWKSWGAIEKASFIAQIATVISLPVAAWFSYASWTEARLARDDQRAYFIEEKSPDLAITSLSALGMDGSPNWLLRLSVKNSGLSPARNVRAEVTGAEHEAPVGQIDPMTRDPSEETIGRGKEKDILAAIIRPAAKDYRWKLDTLKLAAGQWTLEYAVFGNITIEYEGSFGDKHREDVMLIAKQTKAVK